MAKKVQIFDAARMVAAKKADWYTQIASDAEFMRQGGKIYPFDSIGANLDPLFTLMERAGVAALLESGEIATVCDIGCANGEIALSFAAAGFDVTAIDYSFKHDRAPFVVSWIARAENIDVSVVDMSVDRHFVFDEIKSSLVNDKVKKLPSNGKFDLAICLGLIYHLQNPFAFLNSLSRIAHRVVVGTHVITHTPGLTHRVDDTSVAYLVDKDELNGDPTNYWMFTEKAFARLVVRSGFRIIASSLLPNNPLGVAVPDRVDLGCRSILLIESVAS